MDKVFIAHTIGMLTGKPIDANFLFNLLDPPPSLTPVLLSYRHVACIIFLGKTHPLLPQSGPKTARAFRLGFASALCNKHNYFLKAHLQSASLKDSRQ